MRAVWQRAGPSARMAGSIHSISGTVYTFSDGTLCDANAILANFNAIMENKERHTWLEMMNLLVGVSAPDERYLCH